MTDDRDVAADIKEGDHDKQLGDIIQAVLERAAVTETTFPWKITLNGDEWTQQSVTIAELALAEKLTDDRYINFDPIRSADHLVALLVAHYKVVKGLRVEDAVKAVGKLTVTDLPDLVTVYQMSPAPKDEPTAPQPS